MTDTLHLMAPHPMQGTKNVYMVLCIKKDLLGSQEAEDIHEFDDVFPHLISPDYQEIELSKLGECFLVVRDGYLRVHNDGRLEAVLFDHVPKFNRREYESFCDDFRDWVPPVIAVAHVANLPNGGAFIEADVDDGQLKKGNVCFMHDNQIYNQDYGDVVLSRQNRLWKIVHHYMRPSTFVLYGNLYVETKKRKARTPAR